VPARGIRSVPDAATIAPAVAPMNMAEGKWNILVKTPMGDRTGVLQLVVDGDSLTGSLSDGEHFAAISDGKIDGGKLIWSAKISKPMRLTFQFSAVVDQDRIYGSAKHLLGSATFTGTRA
jgi:hypothetical protein